MRYSYGWSAALIGTIAPALVQTQGVLAATAIQVASIAEQISVRIDGQAPGSGVLVARQGQTYFVLTAAHVVATEDEYEVVTPDNQRYRLIYTQVKKLPGVDLAVVQFSSARTYQVARLGDSTQVKRGMTAFVAGWPAGGSAINNPTLLFQQGMISASSQVQQADGYGLIYTNNTLPGMSGGPVLNEKGELVGIHGRGETDRQEQTINPEVVVKVGFNLGVPINTFLALAPKSGLNLGLRSVPSPIPTPNRSSDDLFAQGTNLLERRDYRGALTVFDQAIRLTPRDARLYTSRGIAHFNLRDIRGALSDLNQSLQLDPQDVNNAYAQRGNIYVALGQLPSALADYNQALRLNPNGNARVYYQRSLVYERLGNRLQAIADLNQAIRINPLFAEAYSTRGANRALMGDRLGAMNDFNQALRLNLNLAMGYYNRAALYAQMGNKAQAIADYQRAAQLFLGQGNFQLQREATRQLQLLRGGG